MAKKYTLQRIQKDPNKKEIQVTSRSKLDYGTIDDLRRIDEYFTDLLKREYDSIKRLGLNPESLTIKIDQEIAHDQNPTI